MVSIGWEKKYLAASRTSSSAKAMRIPLMTRASRMDRA